MALLLLASCALWRRPQIGMWPHTFHIRPQKAVWIQVPGLNFQHLADVKFQNTLVDSPLPLERGGCYGLIWRHSLLQLAPSVYDALWMELAGLRNPKRPCEEVTFLRAEGGGVLMNRQDLMWPPEGEFLLKECVEEKSQDLVIFEARAGDRAGGPEFHFQEKFSYEKGQSYRDKSCGLKTCHSPLLKNVTSLYKNFWKKKKNFFFVVQDYSYKQDVKDGQGLEALKEILAIVEYFQKVADQESLLVVLSGVATKQEGALSDLYAYGASSEKLCGIYHSSEVKERILWFK